MPFPHCRLRCRTKPQDVLQNITLPTRKGILPNKHGNRIIRTPWSMALSKEIRPPCMLNIPQNLPNVESQSTGELVRTLCRQNACRNTAPLVLPFDLLACVAKGPRTQGFSEEAATPWSAVILGDFRFTPLHLENCLKVADGVKASKILRLCVGTDIGLRNEIAHCGDDMLC